MAHEILDRVRVGNLLNAAPMDSAKQGNKKGDLTGLSNDLCERVSHLPLQEIDCAWTPITQFSFRSLHLARFARETGFPQTTTFSAFYVTGFGLAPPLDNPSRSQRTQ